MSPYNGRRIRVFVGRQKEMAALGRLYAREDFQFVVMYGRRRVGKTTLLNEFVKDKPALFFSAPQHDDAGALRVFSERLHSFLGQGGLSPFATWAAAFEQLAKAAEDRRFVLIIDEFPYLANANRSIPSLLQNAIDRRLKDGRLFLVLCGSSLGFMERGVLSAKSPLYGRATAQLRITPFDFATAADFYPQYRFESKMTAFGVLGGIPKYLETFVDTEPVENNIVDHILNDRSLLYEEPMNFLREELREPATYNAIIEAIAGGASKLNEIATKAGLPTDKCAKYLRTLISLHVVQREMPVIGQNRKNGIYRICDNFFTFWYRYVFENADMVERGDGQGLYDLFVRPDLDNYIGATVFEGICQEYLWGLNARRKLPFVFSRAGRWWGNDPRRREQSEIDIIAFHKRQALFCECKWRTEKLGLDVLETLRERAGLFPDFSEKHLYLFSRSGFTKGLRDHVSQLDSAEVTLVGLEDLENVLLDTDEGSQRST
ncbi:MAG: ATP-binding protein [Coriobacteriales bacterium]|jgi:AAA+ ATPase superfamily predicted ATPase|nr:ATP-binding protein [Coriobacteriales bacterium]